MPRGKLALHAIVFCGLLPLAGCAGTQSSHFGHLPAITSSDPKAEAELEKARTLDEQGQVEAAASHYQRFILERPSDPLVPIAELSLGKILLRQEKHKEAKALFDKVARQKEAAVAELGRFYGAITAHRLGDHQAAAAALEPLVGRPTDSADTALLLRTLAEAQIGLARFGAAVRTLDTLVSEATLELDRSWAKAQVTTLLLNKASPDEVSELYRELDHDGIAWPQVVRRALRDADAKNDAERVRELLEVMRDENLPIGTDLGAIAMRAERPDAANPQVVGVILSLSGRGRRVGELSLRGLMLAAGLPPAGPESAGAPQVIFRDDGGDKERAVRAVDELFTMHRAIAIIGPLDVRAADAASARAQELGIPMLTLSPGGRPTDHGSMVYRLFATPESEIQALLSRAKTTGKKRVTALLPEGAYGDLMESTLRDQAKKLGFAMTPVGRYAPTTTSFLAHATELAKQPFDTLLLADTAQQVALIAPALATAGLWCTPSEQAPPENGRSISILALSVAFDHDLAKSVGRYLQGALFSVPFDAQTATGPGQVFAQRFEAQFGERADAFAAFAHDAYKLVRAAIDSGHHTRETLASNLWRAESAALAGPSPGFLSDREARRATRLLQLQGDRFVVAP